MPKVLSPEAVAHYHDQGYWTPVPCLEPDEVARYRSHFEAFEYGFGGEPLGPYQFKPYLHQRWAYEIATHRTILDAVEDIIGANIRLLYFTIWAKDPGTEAFVSWHQDSTYFGLSPLDHITAWVALSDSTSATGCVEVVPGSHLIDEERAVRTELGTANMLRAGQVIEVGDEEPRADLEVPAGSFSLHHTCLLHNSRPNVGLDRRIGLGISYVPTHVMCSSQTRLRAMLVRGTDAFNHFDDEPVPNAQDPTAGFDAHRDALARWNASRAEQVTLIDAQRKARMGA
ncbi:MAG: phytanoyl-CoA dioxygenase family protein [Acidimicrobiales bacterium]